MHNQIQHNDNTSGNDAEAKTQQSGFGKRFHKELETAAIDCNMPYSKTSEAVLDDCTFVRKETENDRNRMSAINTNSQTVVSTLVHMF
jgi:hypothetical protein